MTTRRITAWCGIVKRGKHLVPDVFHRTANDGMDWDAYQRLYPSKREAARRYECVARCTLLVHERKYRRPKPCR